MEHITVNINETLGIIGLNRPEARNALSQPMLMAIRQSIQQLSDNKHIRFIIIKGSGPVFCAGADLTWMKGDTTPDADTVFIQSMNLANCFHALYHSPKITMCLVHGGCYGGGNGLVAAADFAFATSDSVFTFTEVLLGLVPATLAPYVLQKIGLHQSKQLMLTGTKISGMEAQSLGLIDKAFSSAEEMGLYADQFLQQLAKGAPKAQRQIKRWLQKLAGGEVAKDICTESARLITASRRDDEANEGIQAFFEKRMPKWAREG